MKHSVLKYLILICWIPLIVNCQQTEEVKNKSEEIMEISLNNLEKATFGAGCFWCIEAAFDQLKGVAKVQSGYAGGHKENPTYKEVTTGETGHAEVIQVYFDPEIISYQTLLDGFWIIHDPTQLNRQGADVGTQYRSEIFYHNEEQKLLAEKAIEKENASRKYNQPLVTKVSALNDNFYAAEDYHTDYYELNQTQPYCSAVIAPKLQKFHQVFNEHLKPEFQ